jgi:hypothetical protein
MWSPLVQFTVTIINCVISYCMTVDRPVRSTDVHTVQQMKVVEIASSFRERDELYYPSRGSWVFVGPCWLLVLCTVLCWVNDQRYLGHFLVEVKLCFGMGPSIFYRQELPSRHHITRSASGFLPQRRVAYARAPLWHIGTAL